MNSRKFFTPILASLLTAMLLLSSCTPVVTKETGAGTAGRQQTMPAENQMPQASDYSHDELWITEWAASQICNNYDADWNYDMIGVETQIVKKEDPEPVYGDGRIKVAILDSGVDFVTSNANIIETVNLVEEDQDLEPMLIDLTGHGSAVAGIISNINPEAEIYSVRVLDQNDTTSLSRVAQGIYWCIENGVNIINMSFGTPVDSEILHQAIRDAKENGILMTAAIGNNPETGVEYPAGYPEVIGVGSVADNWEKSYNNAVGSETELLAPGEEVFVQSMLGLYTIVNGTSFASAHVAGAASLLWQKDPGKSSDFIRGLLKETSNKIIADENNPAGILDVLAAAELFDTYELDPETLPKTSEETGNYEEGEAFACWGTEQRDNGTVINLHKVLVDLGIYFADDTISFSTLEVAALKAGAVYPDQGGLSGDVPYHGRRNKNWIASYKYITAVAKAIRSCSGTTLTYPDPSSVLGSHYSTFTSAVNQIQHDFTASGVWYYKSTPAASRDWYTTLTAHGVNGTEYNALSQTGKRKIQSLFIYGVALHDLTDTFSHASFGVDPEDGVIKPIVHDNDYVLGVNLKGAHDRNKFKNRWVDAKHAAADLIAAAYVGHHGKIADFAPNVTTAPRGYYLDAPTAKACYLSNTTNNQTIFQYIDYGTYNP